MEFSKAEKRVLNLIKIGLGNKEIAWQLNVGEKAVKFQITNIYKKVGIWGMTPAKRSKLVVWVRENYVSE